MLFVVFTIAVLNLFLGFALAVRLHYGPPNLADAWRTWNVCCTSAATLRRKKPSRKKAVAEKPKAVEADSAVSDFSAEDIDSLLDMDEEDEFLDEFAEDNPPGDDEDSGYDPAADEPSVETVTETGLPENWLLDDKNIETSVLRLNIAMMKSGARATDLDTRLRASRGNVDVEALKIMAGMLREDCQSYLSEQSAAADKMHSRLAEFGDLASVVEEIEMGNMQQAAQIETTLSNLDQLDFTAAAESIAARLLEELGKLREARHKLRDGHDVAFLTIALHENRMNAVPKQLFIDELTGLRSRAGLEATLRDWWSLEKQKKHQMNAALFDLDRFGQINAQYGPELADLALREIAKIMGERCAAGELMGRFAGQRFLYVSVDKGPRAAIKDAEYIRQSVARATFECPDHEFNVGMCGGYAEVAQNDTIESLFARLETALAAAKAAGSGQGCFHDGRDAEIVQSPNLGAKYREIKLEKNTSFPGKKAGS